MTSLDGLSITVDGTGSFPLDQFTSITDGSLRIEGGTYSLTNLIDINGSSLDVQAGGSLTLPSVVSFTTSMYGSSYFQVFGAGSVLSLPALTTASGYYLGLQASNSGTLDLPALTTLTFSSGSLIANQGGIVGLSSGLTTLNAFDVTVDGTGTLPLGQFTSITNGSLTVNVGTYSLTNLTDLDGSGLRVENGGSLTLPALQTFNTNNIYGSSFNVSGTGSLLSLPELTSITGSNASFYASGLGSQINAPGLASLPSGASLTDIQGASIVLAPA